MARFVVGSEVFSSVAAIRSKALTLKSCAPNDEDIDDDFLKSLFVADKFVKVVEKKSPYSAENIRCFMVDGNVISLCDTLKTISERCRAVKEQFRIVAKQEKLTRRLFQKFLDQHQVDMMTFALDDDSADIILADWYEFVYERDTQARRGTNKR